MKPIRVLTGFDGACPFSAQGVTENADGTFEVRPSWRPSPGESEEAPGMGSRFSIRAANDGQTSRPFVCFVNWETGKRFLFHDWLSALYPGAPDWVMVPAEPMETGVSLTLSLPPGVTHIDTAPWYGYQTAVDYLARQDGVHGARYEVIGKSREGRDIPALTIDDPDGWKKKEEFLFIARNHAYETAGSFCAEGMIDFLLSDDPLAVYYRARYRARFAPMTNADGVHNGMSRLTAPKGADLNRCREQDDPAWRALKDYIDRVQPNLFLNIHNWTSKTTDGLLANTAYFAENFRRFMPDQVRDGKVWYVEDTEQFLRKVKAERCPLEHASWKDYVRDRFGAIAMTLEFPWFRRNAARMRELGKDALIAFLHAEKYQ